MDLTSIFLEWDVKLKRAASFITDEDIVAIDWAGIGDANCHSRLLIEHLCVTSKVCWLTPEKVASLYVDDKKVKVVGSFNCPYRDVTSPLLMRDIVPYIDSIVRKHIPHKKVINISNNICRYYQTASDLQNYSNSFFRANNITRNFDIKHSLVHNTSINLDRPSVFIEYCGQTCGTISLDYLNKITQKITSLGFDVIVAGSKEDPNFYSNERIKDLRGYSFYDIFSYMKNCKLIIGKSSGNQSLSCFLPNIQLIEIDVPPSASYITCKLHPNVKSLSVDGFYKNIESHLEGLNS